VLWSPDSSRLVAGRTLVALDSGKLTALPGDASRSVWSRDGSRLAVGTRSGIQIVDADGTPLAQVEICLG
jgi:hypothetical protein